jgi:FAD/FMN-containing dehydrogenase
MASKTTDAITQLLIGVVGAPNVTTELPDKLVYSTDISPEPGVLPDIIVRPKTTEEIAEIVKQANRIKKPVVARGAGTCPAWFTKYQTNAIVIDLTRMSDILEINDKEMTVTCQAGVNWGKLYAELRKKGWRVGSYGPGSGASATVGGGLSHHTLSYGCAKYGTASENVTSLKVVLPTGDVINTGSGAYPHAKKAIRYGIGPDLTGLFLGEGGAFGIKTEATMKIYPFPEAVRFSTYEAADLNQMVQLTYDLAKTHIPTDILGFLPWLNESLGSAGFKSLLGKKYTVLAVIEAQNDKIADAQKEHLDNIAKKTGAKEIGSEFLQNYYYPRPFEWWPRAGPQGQLWASLCCKVPIFDYFRPHKLMEKLFEKYKDQCEKYQILPIDVLYFVVNWNVVDALLIIYWMDDIPGAREIVRKMWKEGFEMLAADGGIHYWLGSVIGEIVARNWAPKYYETVRAIKRALDPNGIMIPGMLMLP